ncbi:MAG: bifunctional alpha,alpha-trehalose-phosphate synthase (UDP-forming)/trehalose-phosphatase [Armatimonadota bacterium]|nr:bifunctional alpha,alpha-trehalose-phosphate synthase (UDP-forming)/trehalose-phosphatase [Armatimonadota bacterium]
MLIVANRLPLTVVRRRDGLRYQPSVGGLARGVGAVFDPGRDVWVGWPGIPVDRLADEERQALEAELARWGLRPVHLTETEVQAHYNGFCNRALWPLFHDFPSYAVYDPREWEAYCAVNARFAEAAAGEEGPLWVHDYHLLLVPRLLRERSVRGPVGFFLHIPFPAWQLFRLLPWREEVVDGLLGADLVGFHTYDDVLHFLDAVRRLRGAEAHLGRVVLGERVVRVDAFPMGIDYERFAGALQRPEVRREVKRLRGELRGQRVILSVDRLDYTKGILQRLVAYDRFLADHPEVHGKVTLVLVVVPSRTEVRRYTSLLRQVREQVAGIEGRYATFGWTPVRYLYRALAFPVLAALYHVADVALVTPLRDGMNLIAKEYVASCADGRGVLVLSETAGAARELSEALLVNPNDVEEVAEALHHALGMPEEEQRRRNGAMQARLRARSVQVWVREWLEALAEVREEQEGLRRKWLSPGRWEVLLGAYVRARRRLLLLDYDGTLVEIADRPERAIPDPELCRLLAGLSADPCNRVVLVSGRDPETLDGWFGGLGVDLVAEHGAWVRDSGGPWEAQVSPQPEWKAKLRPVLEAYAGLTPGAWVEEKTASLAWHFRGVDPALAAVRARELVTTLVQLSGTTPLGILHGKQVVEVLDPAVGKGRAARRWLASVPWEFVLAAGDDVTDEELFAVLPEGAHSVRVGFGPTQSAWMVEAPYHLRALLERLASMQRYGSPAGSDVQ